MGQIRVRLSLALGSWSLSAVAKMLLMVRIDAVEVESLHETDTSFFVLYAWVETPDKLPRWVELGTHEPRRNIDPLDHLRLPPGFVQTVDSSTPLPHCPRVQTGLVLVHLDELEEFVVLQGRGGPGAGREGERLGVRPLPWARGSIDGSRSASWRTSVFSRLEGAGAGPYQGRQVAIVTDDKITGFTNGGSGVSPLAAAMGGTKSVPHANPGAAPDVHAHAPCDQPLAAREQAPLTPVAANFGGTIRDNQEEASPPHDSPGRAGADAAALATPLGQN